MDRIDKQILRYELKLYPTVGEYIDVEETHYENFKNAYVRLQGRPPKNFKEILITDYYHWDLANLEEKICIQIVRDNGIRTYVYTDDRIQDIIKAELPKTLGKLVEKCDHYPCITGYSALFDNSLFSYRI